MFCVTNAWHDIPFCDPTRGLHGALNAELLHTLQQGIFEYAIINLFAIKKTPKTTTKKQVLTKNCKHDMLQKNQIKKHIVRKRQLILSIQTQLTQMNMNHQTQIHVTMRSQRSISLVLKRYAKNMENICIIKVIEIFLEQISILLIQVVHAKMDMKWQDCYLCF